MSYGLPGAPEHDEEADAFYTESTYLCPECAYFGTKTRLRYDRERKEYACPRCKNWGEPWDLDALIEAYSGGLLSLGVLNAYGKESKKCTPK